MLHSDSLSTVASLFGFTHNRALRVTMFSISAFVQSDCIAVPPAPLLAFASHLTGRLAAWHNRRRDSRLP